MLTPGGMLLHIVLPILVLQHTGCIVSGGQPSNISEYIRELKARFRRPGKHPFHSSHARSSHLTALVPTTDRNWGKSPRESSNYGGKHAAANATKALATFKDDDVFFRQKRPEGKNFNFMNQFGHHNNFAVINSNGCRHAGDFVCRSTTDRCAYNVCVYTTENNQLLGIPSFNTVRVPCPAGTGLPATFCGLTGLSSTLQIALLLGQRGHGYGHGHGHHHQHHHHHRLTNPCTVTNAACTGNDAVGVQPIVPDEARTQPTRTTRLDPATRAPRTQSVTVPQTSRPTRTLAPRTHQPSPAPATTQPPTRPPTLPPRPTHHYYTIRDSGCPDPFLKIPAYHSLGGKPAPRSVNTEEACKRFCNMRPDCRAIDYDHSWHRCFSYTFSTQTFVAPITDSIVDHYLKTSCHQEAGTAYGFVDCFPGYNVNGGSLQHNVNNIKDCQVKCRHDPTCLGIDFDSAWNTCWFHGGEVCELLNPHKTSHHCCKQDCDVPGRKPGIPYGFSQASVGYQQKGGVHLTAKYTRSECLDTCLQSVECWAVDYKIDNGTCWHIKAACTALLPVSSVTNYRKKGAGCGGSNY